MFAPYDSYFFVGKICMKIKIMLNYKKWQTSLNHKIFHQTLLAISFLAGIFLAAFFYYLQPLGMGRKIYWVIADHDI